MGPALRGWASAALGLGLLLSAAAGGPPAHFLYQVRSECFFPNGTGPEAEVRYLSRIIYDRQDIYHFDSDLGRYEALSPMAQSNVDRHNRDPDQLRAMMADVDRFCRYNYGLTEPFALGRKIPPKMKIVPNDYGASSSSGNTMLICTVDDFFPAKITVRWFRNGKEEKGDQVMTTPVMDNGDWTYWIHVMLETQPEKGDVYVCQAEHASSASPASIEWRPQSDSARSKMWTGIVGLVLGVVFVAAGLSLYVKKVGLMD
ncbi:H-2 class II histocompatibility antigen, E-S beta chain-like isoform X2 [Anolis carolinensis]|uniref:H-2 class II histocompatibility antigen, E-S beta chain-like isoform X2 n=1 Tax=Anolis carolinensis TaxID=28377 RepID=UPI002F2B369B